MTLIRPIAKSDFKSWNEMYSEYIEGIDQETLNKLWSWLMDSSHDVKGLTVENNLGETIGFIHYRPIYVPFIADIGGYVDDLFVTPASRRNGVAKQLIEAVIKLGKEKNWQGIRWITDESNVAAKCFYDKIATRTSWITFDIAPL